MIRRLILATAVLSGLVFFVLAALSVEFSRFGGGTAMIWPASALLAVTLSQLPTRRWNGPLIACALASLAVTGLMGLGWRLAPGAMLGNLAEAVLAARALQRRGPSGREPVERTSQIFCLMLTVVVVAPAVGGLIAATAAGVAGVPPLPLLAGWFVGHGLGMMIFLPGMRRLGRALPRLRGALRSPEQVRRAAGLLAAMATVTAACFRQQSLPLLFLPTLVLTASAAWAGESVLTAMFAALALIGGGQTLAGHGPLALMHTGMATRIAFFQFYLAATLLGSIPVFEVVRRRERLLASLRESEARYRLLTDNSTDIILSTLADGTIRTISPSVLQLGQYRPEDLIGRNAKTLIAEDYIEEVTLAHRRAIANPGETVAVEYLALPRIGSPRWFESHLRAVTDEHGALECVISVIRDISQHKETESALRLAALTDPLTGLANRRQFMAALGEVVARGQPGCLALIDLDHFKQINDHHGHAAGDEVLCAFARLARDYIRATDTIGRIGGEEFALLLPGASLEVARRVCERLGGALGEHITEFAGSRIQVTGSMGLAPLGRDAQETLRAADTALYRAKNAGRAQLAIAA